MPLGFFLVPYEVVQSADGEDYRRPKYLHTQPTVPKVWREIRGNTALVVVFAAQGILDALSAQGDVVTIPANLLTAPLSSLTSGQRRAIRDTLESLGYDVQDILNSLGGVSFAGKTLADLLTFLCRRYFWLSRRRTSTNEIVTDGEFYADAPMPVQGIPDIGPVTKFVKQYI